MQSITCERNLKDCFTFARHNVFINQATVDDFKIGGISNLQISQGSVPTRTAGEETFRKQ